MKYLSRNYRYKFLATVLTGLVVLFFISCTKTAPVAEIGDPRLTAQIGTPIFIPTKGLTQLSLGGDRDGILYVPESYNPNKAMPLLVALHGAGGSSNDWRSYYNRAESRNMIFMAIDSQARTWDLILEGYGEDVEFLDRALKHVFNRCNIDPEHVALCGFSDGATYTLSLGPSNGDIFSHLIGHSPGYFVSSDPLVGKPQIYISHGTKDYVLSVQETRNTIVPTFISYGYDVTYDEFEGGHTVPDAISEAALDWFLGPPSDNSEPE